MCFILCLIHVVAHDTHGIKGPVCEHTVDDDGRRERSSGKDEVDDNHRPLPKKFGCFFKEVSGHFVFSRCFSVSHSVYEEVKFLECGDWVSQPLLSANRSVGEDTRLLQERGVPDSVLIRAKVLGDIAFYMGSEVGYAPVRACVFPPHGCGFLPGHSDRSHVFPYTCGEESVCVGLEKGFRCYKEVVIPAWTCG